MKRFLLIAVLFCSVTNVFTQKKPEFPGKKYPQFFAIDQNVSKGQAPNLMKQYLELTPVDEMRLLNEQQDEIGFTHDKYQQFYKGIKVEGATYTVHAKGGLVKSLSGTFVDVVNVNVSPSLSATSAFANALAHVKATVYAWEGKVNKGYPGYQKPQGELVIVSDDEKRIEPTLAYKFDVYAAEPLYRAYVFIDAKTGAYLKEEQLIHDANVAATANTLYNGTQNITADYTGTTYRLRQAATTSIGAIETYTMNNGTNYASAVDVTSTTTSFTTDRTANAAHWAGDQTYDYYKTKHNRNSFNNAGGAIKSYVHYSTNYVNAFWDGARMTYGDGNGTTYGPLVSIDICGHEITHGVTQFSANLTYSNESGALNESFSDIFGESIENYSKGTNDWLMSQDIGTPFRSMSNPKTYGDPDTYKGTNWYAGTADNGGVHTNSGVQNKWFYILTAGASGTNDVGSAYNVTGLGIIKAAQIAYRNLNVYLSASSNYSAARTGAIQSAIDLFGAGSPEVIATTNAWYAVGVGCAYGASCYCTSSGNSSSYEWIKTVAVGSFTNNSGAAGYTNFTNLTVSLAAGSTNPVTLTPGFASTAYNEYWKIWIDFNKDGDFDDAGEQVFGAGLSKAAVTGNMTIPSTANGSTRMRVSMKYNGQQTTCETFAYGEVEDYTVTFTSAGDTQPPTAPVLSSTGSTENSIGLSWTAATDNVGVTGYDVYANGVLKGTTTSLTFTVSGLSAGTSYSLYVKAKDAAGNSTNSNTISVTTPTAPDITPPSAFVVNSTSSTSGSISLSWTKATDNVGVTGYDVYVDGVLNGSTTTATTYAINGLTPSTTYSIYAKAKDAAGNSTPSNTISVATQAASTTTTLSAHYFETGWDGWIDGGSDCSRYSGSRSYEGSSSILIRDNSGTASAMTSPAYNVTSYNQLTVDFYFYSFGMANGHDFWLRYFDGSTWSTVAVFVAGTDFNNNGFYHSTINLNTVGFPANAQFRFQCDASTNTNQIYIDAVTITAASGATITSGNSKSVTLVSQKDTGNEPGVEGLITGGNTKVIKIYPNPVASELRIDMQQEIRSIKMFTIDGRLVKAFKGLTRSNSINVSELRPGVYILSIQTSEGIINRKFIKQ